MDKQERPGSDPRLGAVQLMHDLGNAIRWLETLGLHPRKGRFGEYLRFLNLISAPDRAEKLMLADPRGTSGRLATCVEDALPLVFLHRQLCWATNSEVLKRLEKFIRGPAIAARERPSTATTGPRDFGVELIVGAGLKSIGMRVEFPSDGDLTTWIDQKKLLLECKRPQSGSKVGKAVRGAASQVRTRLKRPEYHGAYGGAVIEYGKIRTGGKSRLRAPNKMAAELWMRRDLAAIVQRHAHQWQVRPPKGIQFVLVFVSAPAWFDDRGGWAWMHMSAFNPIEANVSSEMTARLEQAGDTFPGLVRWKGRAAPGDSTEPRP